MNRVASLVMKRAHEGGMLLLFKFIWRADDDVPQTMLRKCR